MLLPIKAICDRKKTRKDGTCLIFIQYCYSAGRRTLLNTEIAIPPSYWNKKKNCVLIDLPAIYGSFEQLNKQLKSMMRLVEDIITLAEKNKVSDKCAFVKRLFKPGHTISDLNENPETAIIIHAVNTNREVNKDIFFQLQDYILSKANKVSAGTIRVYEHMRDHLKAFGEYRKTPISFESLDYNFYEEFVEFLAFKYIHRGRKESIVGLRVNTIGQTIKQLRIFIKDRVRRKIIAPIDLDDFKILDEETDAIYLTYEEVGQIYNTDLTAIPYLVEYRDLFVLACLTGLRFSDFSTLRFEDLRKGMLYKKQSKSDHWVVVPLRKEAKEIFSLQFREKIPQLTNEEFNRHIKKIGKLAGLTQKIKFSYKKGNKDVEVCKPKYDWITTHTGRRSFCTMNS